MYKLEIVSRNCFAVYGGKYQELPIGAVISSKRKDAFGSKAKLLHEVKLEVATPKVEPVVEESGSDLESELREFIMDKTGKSAGGRSSIATLKKRAIKLGWEGEDDNNE